MPVRTITELKTLFKRGVRPLFTSFIDLIDTIFSMGSTSVESGVFTLSADGLSATGGILTNPGATPILIITTIKKLKLWQGLSFATGTTNFYSDGNSDGIIQHCSGKGVDDGVDGLDRSNCIAIMNTNAAGWKGLITAIAPTSYTITFMKQGIGQNITGQWQGIMG